MFSPYKFLFSMVLIQFHFLEEFKCLKTKVVWYENPGLPASRRARTPSDARGACSIVCRIPRRAPNISTSFHNSTQNSFIISWVYKDANESSAESDDGMLQSLDLHDSRSAMITFLGQTAFAAGPANNASQNPLWTEMSQYLQHFEREAEWVNYVQVWLHWQDFCWGRVGPEPVNLS